MQYTDKILADAVRGLVSKEITIRRASRGVIRNYKRENTFYRCKGFDGPCDNRNATRNSQNTQYADTKQNWRILCPDCQKAANEDWDEVWAEYYANCM